MAEPTPTTTRHPAPACPGPDDAIGHSHPGPDDAIGPCEPGPDDAIGPCEPGRSILLGAFDTTEGGTWALDVGAAIGLEPGSGFADAVVIATPAAGTGTRIETTVGHRLTADRQGLVIDIATTDPSGRPVDHPFHWQATIRLEPIAA